MPIRSARGTRGVEVGHLRPIKAFSPSLGSSSFGIAFSPHTPYTLRQALRVETSLSPSRPLNRSAKNFSVYEVLVLPLRILIADDHDLVRKGIRSLLEAQKGWEVIGEARDGRDAVEKAAKLKPDVIILDHGMPRLNGLEAVRRIMKVHPQAKVLIVTMHDSDELIREVLDAGARGYVTKSDTGQDLVVAVEALSRNKTYFTSKVDQMVLDRFLQINTGKVDMKPTRDRLTSRQREIVQLLAEGKTSKEVATILGLSTKTVETHRAQIMRRLDCHSVSELVRYAIRNNIVQP